MSTNGNNQTFIDCPHCNQRFSATMPVPAVMNDLKASVAVAAHEKPVRCICGKCFVFVMGTVQVEWGLMPLTDEQVAAMTGSSIIMPTPSLRFNP